MGDFGEFWLQEASRGILCLEKVLFFSSLFSGD